MARLILDTGVLIAAVRGQVDPAALGDTDNVAVPAVVVAEYLAGVALEADPGRAAAQRAYLDDVLAVVPVADYDHTVAAHHAALLAHTRRSGRRRGAHDLIIAATARASGRTLVTTDERACFRELPEVTAHLVTA
ncbi:MAG: PIN domain-containing protein [Actinomycetota bacterium]|nr:PIN domain-containing protein [Actinomycetota bacterium]